MSILANRDADEDLFIADTINAAVLALCRLAAAEKVVEASRDAVGPMERCGLIVPADELRAALSAYDAAAKEAPDAK